MKLEEVELGQVVEVMENSVHIPSVNTLLAYYVGKVIDKDNTHVFVELTALGHEMYHKTYYLTGYRGWWSPARLRLVKPKMTNCICDIQELLWGKRGCVCGWIEIERGKLQ